MKTNTKKKKKLESIWDDVHGLCVNPPAVLYKGLEHSQS
jgi:hypothetical protein